MESSRLAFIAFGVILCLIVAAIPKWRRPGLLFLLVFFAPLNVGWVFRHNNGIFLCDIPLLLLFVTGLIFGDRVKFEWKLPVISFIVWSLLAGSLAERFDLVFSETSRFIRGYLAFTCFVSFVKNRKDFNAAFYGIIVAFAFQGFLGFLQWRWGFLGMRFLGEDSFLYRAAGLFVHPNIFGLFLVLQLPLVLRMFAFHKHRKRFQNTLFGLVFALGMAGLLGAYARASWLSFACACVLMMLYTLFKRRLYPKVVGAAALLALMATVFMIHYTPTIIAQFEGDYRGRAATVRMPLNRIALKMTGDHPITGVGLGNYTLHTHEYAQDEVSDEHHYWELLQIVHNSYLLNLAESGIPGFIFFLWILVLIFKAGWQVIKNKIGFISNIGFGIVTGYVAILIAILAGPDLRQHQIVMVFWILAGFLVMLSQIKSKPLRKAQRPRPQIHPPENERIEAMQPGLMRNGGQ